MSGTWLRQFDFASTYPSIHLSIDASRSMVPVVVGELFATLAETTGEAPEQHSVTQAQRFWDHLQLPSLAFSLP